MPDRLFRDRRDAGRFLAGLLEEYRGRPDVIVLGLPRGGVPVAYEVATALGAPLDVFLVRKLGTPGREELAMGAIASGGVMVINDDVVRGLAIAPEAIQHAAEREGRELVRREQAYREGRPFPAVAGKVVIVVDDGLATGSSMRAAIEALRSLRPARIVVAVPAAPESTCRELAALADEVVCATTPSPFFAVGNSYWDFTQTTDEEVRDLLRAASGSRPAAGTAPGPTEVAVIRADAIPVEEGTPADQVLFDLVGDAQLVLIGEASHGTSEFYAARAQITRRLIEDRGFGAVAAEADWPDAYRVNRYVAWRRGRRDRRGGAARLRAFPDLDVAQRGGAGLRRAGCVSTTDGRAGDERGQGGLLRPGPLQPVPFDPRGHRLPGPRRPGCRGRAPGSVTPASTSSATTMPRSYGFAAAFGAGEACEREVVAQLVDLQRHAVEYARRDGLMAEDELFYAEQNARTVRAAEEYYRAMFSGRVSSWNLRDRHMADTLDALAGHLDPAARRSPRRSWCGRTTPTSATPGRPRSRPAASSTSASWSASDTLATAV